MSGGFFLGSVEQGKRSSRCKRDWETKIAVAPTSSHVLIKYMDSSCGGCRKLKCKTVCDIGKWVVYRSRFLDLLIWERHCKDAGLMHLFYSLTFKLDEKQKKTWFVHCYSFRAPPLEPVRSEDWIRESGGNRAWVGAVRTKSESLLSALGNDD